MTAFDLKLFAIICMLIDHVGAVFFPQELAFRVVGRLAMPIFCFFVAEGCRHTHDIKKYMGRLLLFALLTEIPFDLLFYGRPVFLFHQNMLFTLLLGVAAVYLMECNRTGAYGLFALLMAAVGGLLHVDYGMYGVLLVAAFYLCGTAPQRVWMVLGALTLFLQGGLQYVAILAAIPLCFYNGQRGRDSRWLFYAFYPLHLVVLYGIRLLV